MRIFITGVNGFIGSHLAARLHDRGHQVSGSVRAAARRTSGARGFLCSTAEIRLGEPVAEQVLSGQDTLIHCAYAPGSQHERLNVEGTLAIARSARRAGIHRQIFLSSYSALPDATSAYGRMKYRLEQRFLSTGDTVVRAGLVIGPGGLFLRMLRLVRTLPVLPLPDGGRSPIPIISVSDLCDCMGQIVDGLPGTHFNLAYRREPTLAQLLDELARADDRRRILLPIPTAVVARPLALLRRIGIDLGVDTDNLRGYQRNMRGAFPSDIARFGLREPRLSETIRGALADIERAEGLDS